MQTGQFNWVGFETFIFLAGEPHAKKKWVRTFFNRIHDVNYCDFLKKEPETNTGVSNSANQASLS